MSTCLVVDDSNVIRLVAGRILASLGFTVTQAADGNLAIAACGRAMPDLVLLDLEMPGMNGLDVLRAIRAMPGGDAPAVVLCATQADPSQIKDAIGVGANEYIIKPFDGPILRSKLALLGLLAGSVPAQLG